MVNDSKNSGSVQSSKESNDLLEGMKRYLRIEHLDDDKELLEYLQKTSRSKVEMMQLINCPGECAIKRQDKHLV